MHQFLQFKKIPTFIGDGETVSSKASLEEALSFATGVTTENSMFPHFLTDYL